MSIDAATRTEELARELAATFDRLTLGRFIADKLLETARLQSWGNLALKRAQREARERVSAFDREQAAIDAARAAETRKAHKHAEAERRLREALKEASAATPPQGDAP